jgi:enediyne biosynthesis protein E4
VSQPFNRGAIVPAPIEPNKSLHNWWVENPWLIAASGKSLSGFERNRIFLNVQGREFFEISGLTLADSAADGRGTVAADLTNDGMEDVLVRHVGGLPIALYENRFPKTSWLRVTLRGVQSNREGIGARLVAVSNGRQLVRELFPNNGFMGQNAAHVHFGLGNATKLDQLTIRWPSGAVQEFKDLEINRHVRFTEESPDIEVRWTAESVKK